MQIPWKGTTPEGGPSYWTGVGCCICCCCCLVFEFAEWLEPDPDWVDAGTTAEVTVVGGTVGVRAALEGVTKLTWLSQLDWTQSLISGSLEKHSMTW